MLILGVSMCLYDAIVLQGFCIKCFTIHHNLLTYQYKAAQTVGNIKLIKTTSLPLRVNEKRSRQIHDVNNSKPLTYFFSLCIFVAITNAFYTVIHI